MILYACPVHKHFEQPTPGICLVPTLTIVSCSSCENPRPHRIVPSRCTCGGLITITEHLCDRTLLPVYRNDEGGLVETGLNG